MGERTTDNFVEVDAICMGPTTVMDEAGVSQAVVMMVLGHDNRTQQPVEETLIVDLDMADQMFEELGCIRAQGRQGVGKPR